MSLIEIAKIKLCRNAFFDASKPDQALAVLSQRLCLEVHFGHPDAVEFLEEAVAGHLRVCIATTDDRLWSFTTYPSEPFLSHVAALLMHGNDADLLDTLRCLQKKLEGGMIDKGANGELVSRVLLQLCKDFVAQNIHELPSTAGDGAGQGAGEPPVFYSPGDAKTLFDEPLTYCREVPVILFLKTLFGQDFWPEDNNQNAAAQEAFKDSFVNFSHWVSMTEDIGACKTGDRVLECEKLLFCCDNFSLTSLMFTSSEEWLRRHWCRTSAIQCCHLQPRIDKLIPVYHKDSGLGDLKGGFTCIAISDKMRKDPSRKDVSNITLAKLAIGPTNLPWIAITFDLGLADPQDPQIHSTFPVRSTSDNNCLRIWAGGMSSATFPFLERVEGLEAAMRGIAAREKMPNPAAQLRKQLQDRVKFGETSAEAHMRWEEEQA